MSLGNVIEKVLRAHIQAAAGRYRAVYFNANHDPDPAIPSIAAPHVLRERKFRSGFRWLNKLGLSFDVNLYEPQLPDLIDLAQSFPETQVIVQNAAMPLGMGRYAGKRFERFQIWRPYVENCIEAFGARNCMFKSNAPEFQCACTYAVLWNAFKRLAAGASKEEKTALFFGTATRVYRLDV